MKLHPLLRIKLEPVHRRRQRARLWLRLGGVWVLSAILAAVLLVLQPQLGWNPLAGLAVSAIAGLALAVWVISRFRNEQPDWRALALKLEAAHPELQGRLLTAVQQDATGSKLDYLQERVIQEAVVHARNHNWKALVPSSRIWLAQAAQACALALWLLVLWQYRFPAGESPLVPMTAGSGVEVTPGDAELERGSRLLVAARFKGALPPGVELVYSAGGPTNQRVSMVRGLADPLFSGTVTELASDTVYHLEYGGKRTRDYKITVFDYPRLERADADLNYPEYTGLEAKRIENTRRISAVEGSKLDLQLQLNKAVSRASLLAKGTNRHVIELRVDSNAPRAMLEGHLLSATRTYDLQLVDASGRTNKLPFDFVFNVLKNRNPELKIATPRGDTQPSSLEELVFSGTVFDDFGVQAFGLASVVAGREIKLYELGNQVPGKEKRSYQFLLRLEELGLKPGDLMSWFVWADDIGPDGKVRRTSSDLFFAEIRPFDEVFREGQSPSQNSQQQQQQGGQGGTPSEKLADLQKQIINATWKLIRQNGGTVRPGSEEPSPPEKESNRSSSLWREGLETDLREANPALSRRSSFFGQTAPRETPPRPRPNRPAREPELAGDMEVVRSAQRRALEQAAEAAQNGQDPRTAALWEDVARQMERALEKLRAATNSTTSFQEALAAEQAAYQALLKLQEREFNVSRNRNQQQGQSGRQQQMQRQLDQLELSREENRYESERLAQPPQNEERSEQLQVMNRLQELAQRQEDLNERLKELQTALQAAQTEAEREEIRRELKRLQDEQQQLLADADEVRQRMERPENQSRMTEQQQQMEQVRNDLQRASEAAQQGEVSQALAAGTRAQRQLQEMRDEMRRQNAGEFAEELRQMRNDARELSRRQEEIQKQLEAMNDRNRRSLSDSQLEKEALEQLAEQRQRLTNLVQQATQLSRETEESEPLVSRELYDTLRRFSQDETSTAKDFQEEFLNRPGTTRSLYERLKETASASDAKSLDLTSEMLRLGLLNDANTAQERARSGIEDLRRGVERAAESVLGDDAQSLRLAQEQLERLTEQLEREIAEGENGGTNQVDQLARSGSSSQQQPGQQENSRPTGQGQAQQNSEGEDQPRPGSAQQPGETAQNQNGPERQQDQPGSQQQASSGQASQRGQRPGGEQPSPGQQPGEQPGQEPGQQAGQQPGQPGQQGQPGELAQQGQQPGNGSSQNNESQPAQPRQGQRGNQRTQPGGNQGGGGNQLAWDLDRLLESRGGYETGPITGEDFAPWSDRLREVEELVDTPSLRTGVAQARERARQMRQDYRRNRTKPDWADVRLQVLKPLVEVREAISEELARREPRDNLVPIDRDPVPGKYSELVRRYYEELGRANAPENSNSQ